MLVSPCTARTRMRRPDRVSLGFRFGKASLRAGSALSLHQRVRIRAAETRSKPTDQYFRDVKVITVRNSLLTACLRFAFAVRGTLARLCASRQLKSRSRQVAQDIPGQCQVKACEDRGNLERAGDESEPTFAMSAGGIWPEV